MTIRNLVCGVLALALSGPAVQAQAPTAVEAGALTIVEPWSRATPGGARVGVGYLMIENRGAAPDRLLRAESDVSASAEVHETVTEAGVARMKPVDAVVIAPNGRLEFKPGGYHLMLSGLKRPLKEGERFAAALVFEKAGRVAVTFAVRGIGAETHHHH
jgi:periplasmic copper chaperone A